MEGTMATRPARPRSAPVLRRDPQHRMLGGVCAGLARHLGVDPIIVRIAFVAAAMAGGVGVAIYLLAWVFLPAGEAPAGPVWLRTSRGTIEIVVGIAFLALSVLLTFRAFGLLFSDVIVWPLVLVAAGGALLWRQWLGGGLPGTAPRTPAAPTGVPRASAAAATTAAATTRPPVPAAPRTSTERAALVSRTSLGIALVIAAGIAFLSATGALSAARDVVLSVLVVAVVLSVIFFPWVLRLVRSLTAERAERIRSQERAEMAAHLHDSVLQTLALVQQRSEDPRAVAALARRQERELRAWLSRRARSEEHTSELQSQFHLVCRLLLEKKKSVDPIAFIVHIPESSSCM